MEAVAAGLTAAAAAYLMNKVMIRIFGNIALTTIIPIFEEAFKSFIPALMGTSLLLSHITFGVLEAAYEMFTSKGRGAYLGAVVSFFSHYLLGTFTLFLIYITGSLILSVFGAAFLHILWNRMVAGVYTR